MSGPKSINWYVEENQILNLRILQERQQLARDLVKLANGLCKQVKEAKEKYGEGFPDLVGSAEQSWQTSTTTLEETNSIISSIQKFTESLSSNLAQAVSEHEVMVIKKLLRDYTQEKQTSKNTTSESFGAASEISQEERNSKIISILEQAIPSGPEAVLNEIREFARHVAASKESGRFEVLIIELQYRMQKYNEIARVVQNEVKLAIRLREKLVGLSNETIAHLDQELERIERQELKLRASLPSEVEAAIKNIRKELDQQYAGMVIREELIKLGYHVEEGFETLFVSGGKVRLKKAKLNEYHVAMDVDPSSGRLGVHVARIGDPKERPSPQQLARDTHMQNIWCEDFAKVLLASEHRGVRGRVFGHVRAGELPAEVESISEAMSTNDTVPNFVKRPFN